MGLAALEVLPLLSLRGRSYQNCEGKLYRTGCSEKSNDLWSRFIALLGNFLRRETRGINILTSIPSLLIPCQAPHGPKSTKVTGNRTLLVTSKLAVTLTGWEEWMRRGKQQMSGTWRYGFCGPEPLYRVVIRSNWGNACENIG